jgi:hypothetical protein
MKAISISVALLGLVAVSTAESLRDHLNMMSKRTTAAIKRKDMKGFASCMMMCTTKDFKYSENGQTMTLNQMLDGMKMGVGSFTKLTKVKSNVMTVQEQGDKANVTMNHLMSGYVLGPDKKRYTLSYGGNSVDTFVKVGKSWKQTSMEWKNSTMLFNGKPFDPMKPLPFPAVKVAPKKKKSK